MVIIFIIILQTFIDSLNNSDNTNRRVPNLKKCWLYPALPYHKYVNRLKTKGLSMKMRLVQTSVPSSLNSACCETTL